MKQIRKASMFKFRGIAGIIVFAPIMLIVLLSKPFFNEGTLLNTIIDGLGWLFFILYMLLRLWGTIYVGRKKDRELQVMGPYSVCRNPLYLGSFCFALACALFFQSFLFLGGTIVMAGIYCLWIIPSEEQTLQKIFMTDFEQYRSRIPRVFPSVKNYAEPPVITVHTKGLNFEFKRLLLAGLVPAVAEIIMCCRSAEWWPHMFLFA